MSCIQMEKVNLNVFCQVLMVYFEVLKSLSFSVPFHFEIIHRDLDNSVFVSFPEICFVLIMYCTPSHMLGHVTSSTNGQLYKIKINKDFLMRLLKRGGLLQYSRLSVIRQLQHEGNLKKKN